MKPTSANFDAAMRLNTHEKALQSAILRVLIQYYERTENERFKDTPKSRRRKTTRAIAIIQGIVNGLESARRIK